MVRELIPTQMDQNGLVPGTSYEGILQSGGSETEPSDSEEPGVYNNRRHVLSLNKLVFGNPYGTPQ